MKWFARRVAAAAAALCVCGACVSLVGSEPWQAACFVVWAVCFAAARAGVVRRKPAAVLQEEETYASVRQLP